MELQRFLIGNGVAAPVAEALDAYAGLLLAANKTMNLTRITEPEDVARLHFLDSLAGLPLIPKNTALVDIGAGAGLPGIPIAIARPDLRVTMIESTGKKANFIQSAIDGLGLRNASVLCGRAEVLAHMPTHRERYEVGVSRAVASMPALLELAAGFIHPGGVFLAYKGADIASEMDLAENAMKKVSFCLRKIHTQSLSETQHCIAEFQKTGITLPEFPRKWGKIKTNPL